MHVIPSKSDKYPLNFIVTRYFIEKLLIFKHRRQIINIWPQKLSKFVTVQC